VRFSTENPGQRSGEICGLLLFTYAPEMESRDMALYLLQCHIRSVFLVTSLSFHDFPGVAIVCDLALRAKRKM
jgi:hypothetical protein